jgi:hypothetical protein
LSLQPFQPLEGHSGAVLQQCDHGHGREVVLIRLRSFRFGRGEDLAAGVAAQPLHFKHRRLQRCLSRKPHQRRRFLLAIHLAFAALRAGVAGMQRGMRGHNFGCPHEGSGAIAAMPGGFLSLGLLRGSRIRCQNGVGFLRAPLAQQPFRHSMQSGFQFPTLFLAQRSAQAASDNPIQFLQVHLDAVPGRSRFHH